MFCVLQTTTIKSTSYYPIDENECVYKGEKYQVGDSFHDECEAFCFCRDGGETVCNPIKCPSEFGIDVINPFCIRWNYHKDFVPKPPLCCPPVPVCESDGSCDYKGSQFKNLANIPMNITGCEQRCHCENEQVSCKDACIELPKEVPFYVPCDPDQAIIKPREDRPCCNEWACAELTDLPDNIDNVAVLPENSTALTAMLSVPRLLNGRKGYFAVYLGSGSEAQRSPDEWPKKLVLPYNGIFNVDINGQLRVALGDLLPDKRYFMRIDIHVVETEKSEKIIKSRIVSTVTPAVDVIATEEPSLNIREIDIKIKIGKVKSTSVYVSWRFFTSDEKKYIDGVQIRFNRLRDGQLISRVPGTTPFIHRDTNFFELQDLEPDSDYELDLYLIPVPGADTELISGKRKVRFHTSLPKVDPYDFRIQLKPEDVGSRWIRLSVNGVPTPHQKYVNIFRLLYLPEDHINSVDAQSLFKIAKIQTDNILSIMHLIPGRK